MQPDFDAIFAAAGALGLRVNAYRVRPQQAEMAKLAYQAMQTHTCLVAEAGTGTGKTFAYLVPALLSGGKVIISTGTKNLQDQLFERDLPAVRDALKVPATLALLKGRANYVCYYHLRRTRDQGRFFNRDDSTHLKAIERFANISNSGDKSALADVPEDAAIWSYVTSTRDNCLGQECEFYEKCFVMRARKAAQSAEIVVVNHHLFFADVMLRDEGISELLPESNVVIFDEAHQLPETANIFFGTVSSTTQWLELARDARAAMSAHAADAKEIEQAADSLEKSARDLRLVFGPHSQRATRQQMFEDIGFQQGLKAAHAAIDTLAEALRAHAERAAEIARCNERALATQQRLRAWDASNIAAEVAWLEISNHAVQLHITPLSIAEGFKKQIDAQARAWIFTSATLAVKDDFSHYQREMGLDESASARWQSPFDYATQALLYVPQTMPDPNAPTYSAAVAAAAYPVLRASRGRAFVLCTSLRAMREIHGLLQQRLAADQVPWPLMLQGEGSRSELLTRFRHNENGILVASQSFWEGVDVKGAGLSLVIIDKLPFSAPDDPVMAARLELIRSRGGNPFMEYQLPRAVISLKQGAGRLIRDESDRGVLMICDPRLISKPYGAKIWQSLPPMRRTRALIDVEAFFTAASAG